MSTPPERTFAAFAFARLGDLRDRVRGSREFGRWLATHPVVDVDGERFYVTGGDRLSDEQEMQLTWARDRHEVDESTIQRLQAEYAAEDRDVTP
jgi:hypothetical protein